MVSLDYRAMSFFRLAGPRQLRNFALVSFEDYFDKVTNVPRKNSVEAFSFLKSRGIIVRPLGGYGLPDALRISIGMEDEMRLLVNSLNEFLE